MRTQDEVLLQHELAVAEGILESKEQYRKIVKAATAQWIKDLQAGNIKMQTVQDMGSLINWISSFSRTICEFYESLSTLKALL